MITQVGTAGGGVPDEVSQSFAVPPDFVVNEITKLTRVLVGWRFQTNFSGNELNAGQQPAVPALAVAYEPSPDGEGLAGAEEFAGDKLWREHLNAQPHAWTDGTLHSTYWWADSGAPRSASAQRIIHDESNSFVTISLSHNTTGEIVTFGDTVPTVWTGFVWVAYLLEKAF